MIPTARAKEREPPDNPDLVLDTTGADIDELAARVIALLNEISPRPQT